MREIFMTLKAQSHQSSSQNVLARSRKIVKRAAVKVELITLSTLFLQYDASLFINSPHFIHLVFISSTVRWYQVQIGQYCSFTSCRQRSKQSKPVRSQLKPVVNYLHLVPNTPKAVLTTS